MEINNRMRIKAVLTLSLVVTFMSVLVMATPAKQIAMKSPIKLITEDDTLKPTVVKKQQSDTTLKTQTDTTTKFTQVGAHKATWYRTDMHPRVHRKHPTAAYNFVPRGTKLLVTNTSNNKSCVVEVTDRMGKRKSKHIDLSHAAFGIIANHKTGAIIVDVKILD